MPAIVHANFRHLLEDLDFPAFAGAFTELDADKLAWVEQYWTNDAQTINRRNAMLWELHGDRAAEDELDACIKAARKIREVSEYLYYKTERMRMALARQVMAENYITSCEALKSLLARHQVPELAPLRDKLAAQLETLERVRAYRKAADEVNLHLTHMDFGVNVTESGEAKVLLPQLPGEENYPGPIAGDRDDIVPAIRFPKTGSGQSLEQFLRKVMQIELEPKWKKLEKALSRLPVEVILAWAQEAEELVFLWGGLRMARMLAERGCPVCKPTISDNAFAADRLYYPHLALAALKSVSPYSFTIAKDKPVLITGANHAGKTSFLKAIGQSCILAQMGFLIPAKSFVFVPAAQMFALFSGGEDTLSEGERNSRFQMDARFLREMLAQAEESAKSGAFVMTMFNEPFTGTNPAEAVELLRDLILRLQRTGVLSVTVTHFYDVYELLEELPTSFAARYEAENDLHIVEKRPPDGTGMTRGIAEAFGVTLPQLLGEHENADAVQAFLERRQGV